MGAAHRDQGARWDPLHRSLPTLALRVRAAQANATELAARLPERESVVGVGHPSLAACDPLGLVGRQMDGPGSILTLELEGGIEVAGRVMEHVELITPAVSLGSTDSLIEHPAGLTHRVVEEDAQTSSGITPGLLRLSVGIEDVEDIWDDLDRAITKALS